MANVSFLRPARSRVESAVTGVAVTGHPDAAALQRLDTALRRAAEAAETVVLDLHGLTALDVDTAWLIVRTDLHIRAGGGHLVLLGGPRVQRFFVQSGLDGLLELVDRPSGLTADAVVPPQ
jgi:anti-anti-sigma regulatory factor